MFSLQFLLLPSTNIVVAIVSLEPSIAISKNICYWCQKMNQYKKLMGLTFFMEEGKIEIYCKTHNGGKNELAVQTNKSASR